LSRCRVKPSDLRATYRCPFSGKSGEPQWEPSARTVPRVGQTSAAPRDNTLPPRFLLAGANLGSAFSPALVFRPRNELSRLVSQPRPDLGSGSRRSRFRRRASGSRGRLRRRCRARPSGHAETVHSAIPPKRRVRASEWRLPASARSPDSLYGIARPEPCGDIVFALEKGGVGLVLRRSRRRKIAVVLVDHLGGYRFWRPKVFSNEASFFVGPSALRWNLLQLAECRRYSLHLCENQHYRVKLRRTDLHRIAMSRGQSRRVLSCRPQSQRVAARFGGLHAFAMRNPARPGQDVGL
jgi:hypothetical protein